MFLMHRNINNEKNGVGRRHFFENTNWLCKKYEIESLLDSESNISKRLRKIDSISKILNLKIQWEFGQKTLTRYTEKLGKSSRQPTKEDCKKIAHMISEAHSIDLIHGDINRKNIIIHESGVTLSDWEPSLIQAKKGKVALMATYPYIDPDDLKKRQITKNTDLFSFACYSASVSEGDFSPMRALAISKPEKIKSVVSRIYIDMAYNLTLSDFQ